MNAETQIKDTVATKARNPCRSVGFRPAWLVC